MLPNCVAQVPLRAAPLTAPSNDRLSGPMGLRTTVEKRTASPTTWMSVRSDTPVSPDMVPRQLPPASCRSHVNFCVPIGVTIVTCHLPATLIETLLRSGRSPKKCQRCLVQPCGFTLQSTEDSPSS